MKSIIHLIIFISANLIFSALIKQPHQFKFTKISLADDLKDKFKSKLSDWHSQHSEIEILIKSAERHPWEFRYKKDTRVLISVLKSDQGAKYRFEEFAPHCIGAKFVNPLNKEKCVNSLEYIEKRAVCPPGYILVGHGLCIKKNSCPSGMLPSPVIYPVPCIPMLRSFDNYSCPPGQIQIGGKACADPSSCEKGFIPAPFRWRNKCIEGPQSVKAWSKSEIQKITRIRLKNN